MEFPPPKPNRASERQRKAYQMRLHGNSYHVIAKVLGYHDASGARKAAMRTEKENLREQVQTHRVIEFNRLEMLYQACLPKALAGDIKSAWMVVSIITKEADLLGGYGTQKMKEKQEEEEEKARQNDHHLILDPNPYRNRNH